MSMLLWFPKLWGVKLFGAHSLSPGKGYFLYCKFTTKVPAILSVFQAAGWKSRAQKRDSKGYVLVQFELLSYTDIPWTGSSLTATAIYKAGWKMSSPFTFPSTKLKIDILFMQNNKRMDVCGDLFLKSYTHIKKTFKMAKT